MTGNAGDDSMSGGDGQDVMLAMRNDRARIPRKDSAGDYFGSADRDSGSLTDGGMTTWTAAPATNHVRPGRHDAMHGGSGDDYMEATPARTTCRRRR